MFKWESLSTSFLSVIIVILFSFQQASAQTGEVQGGMYEGQSVGQIDFKFTTTSGEIPKNNFMNLVFAVRYPISNTNVNFDFSPYNPLNIEEQDASFDSFDLDENDFVDGNYRYRTFAMPSPRRLGTTASTTGNWDVNTPITLLTFTVTGIDPLDLELIQDVMAESKGAEWYFATSSGGTTTNRTNTMVPYIQSKILPTPLPVELISLTANQTQQGTHLKWATASESDNKGFEVFRRMENEAEFKQIGFVNGKGNTTQITEYAFDDKQNVYRTAYYRLRQVDFAGTASFSQIVAVTGKGHKLTSFTIYPNPAADMLRIQADAHVDNLSVVMYSAEGRMVMSKEIKNGEQFSVAHLPQGLYQVLYITENGQKGVGKIIVQK